jgi:hypothetical protein
MMRLVMIYRPSRQPFTASGTRVRERFEPLLSHFRTPALSHCRFGRVPPLRSGPGCARTRARYNRCQRRRAPSAGRHDTAVPSCSGFSALRARIPHATATSTSLRRASVCARGGPSPRKLRAEPSPTPTPPPKLGEGSAAVARNERKGGRGRGPRVAQRRAPPGQKPYRPPIHPSAASRSRHRSATCHSALRTSHFALRPPTYPARESRVKPRGPVRCFSPPGPRHRRFAGRRTQAEARGVRTSSIVSGSRRISSSWASGED